LKNNKKIAFFACIKDMKLKDYKFSQSHDEKVFKALKMTFKDRHLFDASKGHFFRDLTNKNLIERCYNSRKNHPDEGIFTNYLYWMSDVGLPMPNANKALRFMWSSRLISIIGKKNITCRIRSYFFDRINELLTSKNVTKQEKIYLMDNSDVIRKAFKICDTSKNTHKTFFNILNENKQKIPF
jgi:hypothetical protein